METKQAAFRIDLSRETGEVMLLINTECGPRPVMCWPDVSNFHDFARKLLGICYEIQGKDVSGRSSPVDECLGESFPNN